MSAIMGKVASSLVEPAEISSAIAVYASELWFGIMISHQSGCYGYLLASKISLVNGSFFKGDHRFIKNYVLEVF